MEAGSKPPYDEHDLERLRRRGELILHAAGEGIYGLDCDGITTFVNPAAAQMLGWTQEELIGKPQHDVIHHSRPDGSSYARRECPIYAAFKDGKVHRIDDEVFWRKDGSSFPVEYMSTPIREEDGSLVGAVVTFSDITSRKKAESDLREALNEIEALKNRLQAENVYLQEEIKLNHNFEEIVGESRALRAVLHEVEQVAETEATVLILGETGTGKELIARAIHDLSDRRTRPLVKVNCAALPSTLIESELFGHERGAFTGAQSRRQGRFELADGGTIFLDEVGDLPLELQAKLLRVLQEGEFERVGGTETKRVDVRVIAATNRDLAVHVRDGAFRSDLYYRLNVFPISLPPLRKRKSDIPILVRMFTERYARKLGRDISTIPQEVLDQLRSYPWPGNIRELQNVIERSVIASPGEKLRVVGLESPSDGSPPDSAPGESTTMEEVEREHIVRTLERSGWKIQGPDSAADLLDMNPSTLRSRMRKLGIERSLETR
ncbi:MAG: sigma 54-interacting transcriptional regulator [Gemmatimonadota bacterium]